MTEDVFGTRDTLEPKEIKKDAVFAAHSNGLEIYRGIWYECYSYIRKHQPKFNPAIKGKSYGYEIKPIEKVK